MLFFHANLNNFYAAEVPTKYKTSMNVMTISYQDMKNSSSFSFESSFLFGILQKWLQKGHYFPTEERDWFIFFPVFSSLLQSQEKSQYLKIDVIYVIWTEVFFKVLLPNLQALFLCIKNITLIIIEGIV